MELAQPASTGPDLGKSVPGHATDNAPKDGEDVWDEERIETALRTLKEMHIQVRELRTTIPRLIAPLAKKQPSPESLFNEFSASAKTATREVSDFKHLMKAEDSIKVFNQAKKSRAEKPQGIMPWRVTDHPDWLTRDKP